MRKCVDNYSLTIETSIGQKAQAIMDKDAELLASLQENPRHILHFYSWERPSLTYGYFIDPRKHLNLEALENEGIDMARRPTGGGIIFHLWDMAFSLLVPKDSPLFHENPIENYKVVHNLLLKSMACVWKDLDKGDLLPESCQAKSVNTEHFCMATPTKYDLMIGTKKLAGAAQRKTRYGYLHQGTISLATPDYEKLKIWLLHGQDLSNEIQRNSFIPLESGISSHKVSRELQLQIQKQITAELQQFLSNEEGYERIGSIEKNGN